MGSPERQLGASCSEHHNDVRGAQSRPSLAAHQLGPFIGKCAGIRLFTEPKRTAEDRWPYNPSGYPEVHMTSVTVRLTDRELKMLKARTGEKDASAAVKAWITRVNPRRSASQLRAALRQSLKEEAAGRGRRFGSGREAMRWLES